MISLGSKGRRQSLGRREGPFRRTVGSVKRRVWCSFLLGAVVCFFLFQIAAAAEGKGLGHLFEAEAPQEGELERGWTGFKHLAPILDGLIALVLATLLSGAIAYHPKTYGKASTLEEVDQPKIFIMYAIVGAVIATIVNYYSVMAAVVFGIGGLLRFRTDVGPAKDTGRVILVTLIGIGCGLKVYPFAVLSTVYAWGLIWLLERRATHRLVVKGLDASLLAKTAEAYEEVLLENGLRVMSQKKNFVKGQVAFVFRAPGELDREELESLFKDIPPKLQGAVDWESS